jgi:hypothetical protein
MVPAGGAGVFKGSADDILKASIHGAMRQQPAVKEKPAGARPTHTIMRLIERVFGRPAASKTASAAFLLKGLARPSVGPAQRNPGLAAPWGLRTEDRAQWTRNWRGRSAGMAPDVAAPELRGLAGRFRGHCALEAHEVRWPGMAAAVKQHSVSANWGQSMPPGEAFSRVKIDEQLRDVGWNLTDDRPHPVAAISEVAEAVPPPISILRPAPRCVRAGSGRA